MDPAGNSARSIHHHLVFARPVSAKQLRLRAGTVRTLGPRSSSKPNSRSDPITMRFFFADSQDYIDPGYDFSRDQYSLNRQAQRDDLYAHEYYETPPYDGILVSRATVGDERWKGKYSTAQSIRF